MTEKVDEKQEDAGLASTDLRRWRLNSTEGVHHWRYLSEDKARQVPQSFAERYFLGLPTASPPMANSSRAGSCALTCCRTLRTCKRLKASRIALATGTSSSSSSSFRMATGVVTMVGPAFCCPDLSSPCILLAMKSPPSGGSR
jgi:hypothetical protein